jgi:hypothetical protein
MKINTLSLRAKFRDYYDLYVMNKEKFSIEDIFNFTVKYLPGITKKVTDSGINEFTNSPIRQFNNSYNKMQYKNFEELPVWILARKIVNLNDLCFKRCL